MRARTDASDIESHLGRRVRVCGWVDRVDEHPIGRLLVLRDRSGCAPLVIPVGVGPGSQQAVPEAAIDAVGTVVADETAGVALLVEELAVVGAVLEPLPIGRQSTEEERLDWRYLDLRQPRNRLIFEVQTTAEAAMRDYWARHGFLEIHSPKLRPNPNRTGRELFTVGYFDRQAYLVQSPQFYKQMAMAAGFERVFEIGPVFRANPTRTARHDTEFTSVDVEISWIDSHRDVMDCEQEWLRHVIAAVQTRHGAQIAQFFGVEVVVPDLPFPQVALEDARKIAEASSAQLVQPPGDLDAGGERALGRHVAREYGHQFVFVIDYPAATRPFYHMRLEEDPSLAKGFDLLWNGMEVTTGAQREHRYQQLVEQAEERGIPLAPIRYYLDSFRFGCPPHGGFGLGLTRMLMALLGVPDVRNVTFLYRGPDRLSP